MDDATFAARVKEAMDASGNVTALAGRVGVHRDTLYRWAEGRVSGARLSEVAALADAAGWTLDYLTGRSDDPRGSYSASGEAARRLALIASEAQQLAESLRPTPRDEPR